MKVHDALARGRTTAGGRHYPVPGGMLETAENLRRQYGIPRQEQDELAVTSHQRAVAAQKDGILAEEIIPVAVRTRQGEELIDTDEHPRADTSVETLSKLKPVLLADDPEATVTAGNSSGQNDAASMCIVTTPQKAAELGLTPLVRLVSWGSAGVAPNIMGIGPVPATEAALGKAGLKLSDIDLIELNEAFAAQALAVMREWKFAAADLERTNVHGSGISLGHPVGATGGRMLATLARELNRRGGRYGLETMCIGGGQGLAAVFERLGCMTQTRPDARAHRVSDRNRRHGTSIRRQRGHPDRAGARAHRHLPAGHRRCDEGDGPVRADDPRGVRRPRRVSAHLRVVRRGACARVDERLGRDQHPLHRRVHDCVSTAPIARSSIYLPRMATGETRGAFSMSEPELGSDVAAIRTRAKRNADGTYTIDGQKMWLTNGGSSTLVAALVRTDEGADKPHRNLTAFLIEKPTGFGEVAPGLTIPGKIDKLGYKGIDTTELIFDGYVASADDILGEAPGQGFFQMMDGIEVGRVNVSARACGVGIRAFELAVRYAQQRHTFGKPIADHQAIAFQLAEMATKIEAAHLMMVNAARLKDSGERNDVAAGMAKYLASEFCSEVTQQSFRIHGGYGYSKEYEIERLMRDAPFLLIGEGTSEIQKNIISKRLLADYRI